MHSALAEKDKSVPPTIKDADKLVLYGLVYKPVQTQVIQQTIMISLIQNPFWNFIEQVIHILSS